jgi:hypothetical protein
MEVAFGVGSLVLVAGGITAMIRKWMRPGQAVAVLVIAIAVAAVALLAQWLAHGRGLGGFYTFAVTATTTLAGIVMTIAVVSRPHSRMTRRGP